MKWVAGTVLLLIIVGGLLYSNATRDFRRIDYIGKTRAQIIAEYPSYEKVEAFSPGQMMMLVGESFHYFDTTNDIQTNELVMSAPEWGINFKRKLGIPKDHFFTVYFTNDVVVRQQKDAIGE